MRLPAFTIIAMLVLIGCHGHHKKPKARPLPASAPAPYVEQTAKPFTPPAAPTLPVKEGQSPLVYMIETGGPVRVVEVESGLTIAEAVASDRSIVSVDDQAGVRIGSQLLVKGPLTSGRTYQIYLETGGSNVFRQETITPQKSLRSR